MVGSGYRVRSAIRSSCSGGKPAVSSVDVLEDLHHHQDHGRKQQEQAPFAHRNRPDLQDLLHGRDVHGRNVHALRGQDSGDQEAVVPEGNPEGRAELGPAVQHMDVFDWNIPSPGMVSISIFDISGDVIDPGQSSIALILFAIDEAASFGASTMLSITNLDLKDENGESVITEALGGSISVGTKGDVNNDGHTNIIDAINAVNIILGVTVPTAAQEWAADCNGDGVVNILDVLRIVNVILGVGQCSP